MQFKDIVSTTNDAFTALRDIAIVALVGVFLFNQKFVSDYLASYAKALADAGQERGAKTEVNTPLAKYTFDQAADTLTSLNSAKSGSDESINQLDKLKSSVASPELVAQINSIEQKLRSTGQAVDQSIKATQEVQSQSVAQIPAAPGAAGSTAANFGISVAADRMREHAIYEVQLLKKNHFSDIAVYSRKGLYITVAQFPGRDAANDQLHTIRVFRPTAYLVNIANFCQNPSPSNERIDTVAVTDCQ